MLHYPTRGWWISWPCRNDSRVCARPTEYKTRGYGTILGSPSERHTVHFAGRSRRKILSLSADADWCGNSDSRWRSVCLDGYLSDIALWHSPEAPSKPGGSSGVPSLSCDRGGLLSPFLPMPNSARGKAGSGRRTPCHIIRRGVYGFQSAGVLFVGRRSCGGFLPPYGRCGCTVTRSFSEVVPPTTRRLCTTRGGLLNLGIKEAPAPCYIYPCNRAFCKIVIKLMTSEDTVSGVPLALFKKKKL